MEESLIQVQNRLQLGRYKARLKQVIFFGLVFCWVSLTILLIIWSVVEHWPFAKVVCQACSFQPSLSAFRKIRSEQNLEFL